MQNPQPRTLSYKSHPKSLNPARSSQPSRQQSSTQLKQRPFLHNVKHISITQEGAIASAKVRLQRPHDYLIRKESSIGIKEYESEIGKLSRICQEFFRENQGLKERVRDRDIRLAMLENQLRGYKQNQGVNYLNAPRKSIPAESQPQPQPQTDPQKLSKLLQDLQARESQLLKYMHKESQFIEIYVQKEQLEGQLRSLQAIITAQGKELDELRKGYRRMEEKVKMEQLGMLDQSVENLERSKLYNQRLLEMLEISSREIQRLNHILKIKISELDKAKAAVEQNKLQITTLKQKLQQRSAKPQPELHSFKNLASQPQKSPQKQQINLAEWIKKQQAERVLEDICQELRKQREKLEGENQELRRRLEEQVGLAFELRKVIGDLEQKCRAREEVGQQDAETQTQQPSQAQYQPQQPTTQQPPSHTQSLESHIKSLKQQNSELTKFLMQQNTQIVSLKQQLKTQTQTISTLEAQLHKLAANEKQLPLLLDRVHSVEAKLNLVTGEYEKLLEEVQSSCGESETVHRRIEQILEEKADLLSQDFEVEPIKTRSEADYNPRVKMSKLRFKENDHFLGSELNEPTSIRIEKDSKSQSQAQLLNTMKKQ